MPDPIACLLAVLAAAGTSAAVVLVLGRQSSSGRVNAEGIAGVILGLIAGYAVLRFKPAWPPASGMDRFLTILLPAAIGIELAATIPRLPRGLTVLLRIGLAMSAARILLHGSVYLRRAPDEPMWRVAVCLGLAGTLLLAEWCLLVWLRRRVTGVALPLALAESLLCGGIAVMLAGYLRGGEAALPPAAALVGAGLASAAIGHDSETGTIGIGLVSLFGLLFLGCFFGRLPTGQGLAVFLAPLACWAVEQPAMARQKHNLLLRLGLVALPLIVVLVLAERHFEHEFRPLMP